MASTRCDRAVNALPRALTSFRAGCYGSGRWLRVTCGPRARLTRASRWRGIAASVVYRSRGIDAGGRRGLAWDLMKQIPLTPRRWTRAEYDRLVNLGVLHGNPVELVGGQLVVAEPQGSYHASALGAAGDALRAVLPQGWLVRIQMPVALDDEVRAGARPGRGAGNMGQLPRGPPVAPRPR